MTTHPEMTTVYMRCRMVFQKTLFRLSGIVRCCIIPCVRLWGGGGVVGSGSASVQLPGTDCAGPC